MFPWHPFGRFVGGSGFAVLSVIDAPARKLLR
jgi:hypothetical protein